MVAALKAAIKSQGFTSDIQQVYARFARETIRRFLAIKETLDGSSDASDTQLIEAKQLVSLYLAQQAQANRLVFTSKTTSELETRSTGLAEKLAKVVERLQTLSVEIQAKYPNVANWGFLPTS